MAIEHAFPAGDAKPIKQRIRRIPTCFVEEEEAYLKKCLMLGFFRVDLSTCADTKGWWASALVCRLPCNECADYKGSVSSTTAWRMSWNVSMQYLVLQNRCKFCLLQVKIKKSDRRKTDFMMEYGLFEFVRMAFGFCGALVTYTRVVYLILRRLNRNVVLAFLDDILVLGKKFEEQLSNLRKVLVRLRE